MGWGIDTKRFDQTTRTFAISSKREVSIDVRDHVVAVARARNEVRFLWVAKVEEVKRIEQQGKTLVRVGASAQLEPTRRATDYAYSLLKVYNFDRPWLHFRRQYVHLDDFDIETLAKGRIFWSRTIVGHLANALPEARLLQILSNLTLASAREGANATWAPAVLWEFVRSFIAQEYLRPADILHHAVEGLRQLAGDEGTELPVDDVAVSDETEFLGRIAIQAQRFDALSNTFHASTHDTLLRRLDIQVRDASWNSKSVDESVRITRLRPNRRGGLR